MAWKEENVKDYFPILSARTNFAFKDQRDEALYDLGKEASITLTSLIVKQSQLFQLPR
jgi:hypothetical protein